MAADLKQGEVAEKIEMTADSFSRALSGNRAFAAVELARLSEFLHASTYWLITGERDPSEPLVVARHTFDQRTGARHVDWDGLQSVVDDVTLAYHQVELLDRVPNVPSSAGQVRDLLGSDFVRDFADRVENNLNVDVVRVDGLPSAATLRFLSRTVVIIGETPNWFYENFSLAHEVAHVALGHEVSNKHSTAVQESAANEFAAELLMPEEVVRSIDWERVKLSDVADLVWDWGISTAALSARLDALTIAVTPALADALASLKTQGLLRRYWAPPAGPIDEITRRMDAAAARRFPLSLQEAHVRAIAEGRVRKDTLAWMLGVAPESLEVDEPGLTEGDVNALADALGFLPA
ncbi:ImmA/IrrE family metallo-endopeptidase [Rathayibacter soli]|uniref:ImmA/IrrE family metallo-endopeptidase n=1 Tax=Rathayibacter soli TaxID=3144168 RepID=UPI0027E3B6B8|nr:XRE family transcriptional regulator [Glaciibacter superstes]